MLLLRDTPREKVMSSVLSPMPLLKMLENEVTLILVLSLKAPMGSMVPIVSVDSCNLASVEKSPAFI